MSLCQQTSTQNVLEHGQAVHETFLKLLNHISGKEKLSVKLPAWLSEYENYLDDINSKIDIIKVYHHLHDCGKPACKEVDSEGNQHFPNHALFSYNQYIHLFGNDEAAELILHDMSLHLLKAEGIVDFCMINNYKILLLTSLAEILANASMFGGTESVSYKIKYKHIDRRGRAIFEYIKKFES